MTNILNQIKPNVATLNEINFRGNRKLKIEGFTSYNRNRLHANMGGVATCIDNKEACNALKVTEGANDDEYIVTRHSQFITPINILNVYGETESRATNTEIKDRWERILKELATIELKGEFSILIGDLNKQVGDLIKGNMVKSTFGGSLVKELLETEKYILVNATNKVVGGPFTRFDPANHHRKSCIDLVIISKGLLKYLVKLTIDRKLAFTPGRPVKKDKIVYSDHRSLILEFQKIPLKLKSNNVGENFQMWNTNKVGGWEVYKMITENNNKLENASTEEKDPTDIMKIIDNELTKAKFKAFGKVKIRTNSKTNKDLQVLQKEKANALERNDARLDEDLDQIEKKMAETLLSEQRKGFETELNMIKDMKYKKGKSASIFTLKSKIVGKKKMEQEATVIVNPDDRKEITEPAEIRKVSLEYCKKLLTNREPKGKYEEDIQLKVKVHEKRMKEIHNNDIIFSRKLFEKSWTALTTKKSLRNMTFY